MRIDKVLAAVIIIILLALVVWDVVIYRGLQNSQRNFRATLDGVSTSSAQLVAPTASPSGSIQVTGNKVKNSK